MRNHILIFCIILILFSSFTYAEDYYADISIDIDSSGKVIIDGKTNNPNLIQQTNELTSKKGEIWTFEYNSKDKYEIALFSINLPKGSTINYMKFPQFLRISHTDDSIKVIGLAEDSELDIVLQYNFENQKHELKDFKILNLLLIVFLILFSLGFFFYKKLKIKKIKNETNLRFNYPSLPERQEKIINLLKEKDYTQAELEKLTNFPKSSLSRNIESLRRKNLILKESYGVKNIIRLNKEFFIK